MTHRRCSSCRKSSNISEFKSKTERICKTCNKCREKVRKSSLCKHRKNRYHCRFCNGTALCKHYRSKYLCKKCRNYSVKFY